MSACRVKDARLVMGDVNAIKCAGLPLRYVRAAWRRRNWGRDSARAIPILLAVIERTNRVPPRASLPAEIATAADIEIASVPRAEVLFKPVTAHKIVYCFPLGIGPSLVGAGGRSYEWDRSDRDGDRCQDVVGNGHDTCRIGTSRCVGVAHAVGAGSLEGVR